MFLTDFKLELSFGLPIVSVTQIHLGVNHVSDQLFQFSNFRKPLHIFSVENDLIVYGDDESATCITGDQ